MNFHFRKIAQVKCLFFKTKTALTRHSITYSNLREFYEHDFTFVYVVKGRGDM